MIRVYLDTSWLISWFLWKIYPQKHRDAPFIARFLSENKNNVESYISIISVAEIVHVLKYGEEFSNKKIDFKTIEVLIEELQSVLGLSIIQKISDDIDGVRISGDTIKFLDKHPHIIDCMHIDVAKYNELTFVTNEKKLGMIKPLYGKIMTANKLAKQLR